MSVSRSENGESSEPNNKGEPSEVDLVTLKNVFIIQTKETTVIYMTKCLCGPD